MIGGRVIDSSMITTKAFHFRSRLQARVRSKRAGSRSRAFVKKKVYEMRGNHAELMRKPRQ